MCGEVRRSSIWDPLELPPLWQLAPNSLQGSLPLGSFAKPHPLVHSSALNDRRAVPVRQGVQA